MPHVTVSVNGRNYRMACDPGQEDHLVNLAARLDRAIDEFREAFGEIGDQRLTVMASILMVDKLDEAEKSIQAMSAELARVGDEHQAALQRAGALETELVEHIGTAMRRIEAMAADLGGESRDASAMAV